MRRVPAVLATLGLLAVAVSSASASEPPSHEVAVPNTPGETVEVAWTGTILPGAAPTSSCAGNPTADAHEITLTVPEGIYDGLVAIMAATVTPVGDTADQSDVIVSMVDPDGTATSGDGGFAGVAETATLRNPAAGTYTVLACAFAAALPVDYEGSLTIGTQLPAGPDECSPPVQGPKWEMGYIDESRAGGEPYIATHPDGQLLWGSHAGTTHFYTPSSPSPTTGAFVENYEGQTYQYFSDDQENWEFVPRLPAEPEAEVDGFPATGFSDPEFAIEQDGTVYISEINLANVAVSKSEDGGRTYELVNVFAFTSSDRQWMAADGDGELYMTANGFGGGSFPSSAVGNLGHFMAKSTDGGLTWGEASTTNEDGVGDIQIDHDRGILYELTESGGTLSMARFPNIRDEDTEFTVEHFTIAEGLSLSGVQRLIDPSFDLDSDGNLYATWSDNPPGEPTFQGIFYAYSTDQGETWSEPQKVDADPHDDVWPWITVGEPGNVAVTWLQSSLATDDQLGGEAGGEEAQWDVVVATTDTGLGCADAEGAGFRLTTASSEPIHTGTICQHGTTCQTDLTDRRLGDYFSIETDGAGNLHVAVSDTRQGGATALPLHIRQTGSPTLVDPDAGGSNGAPSTDPDDGGAGLAETGGGAGLATLLLVGLAVVHRRRTD